MSIPIRSSASKFAFNHHNLKDTQHTHLFCETEQYLTLNYVALPVTIVTHLLPFHPFSPCLLSGSTQTLATAGRGNRDPSPLHSPPAVSLPTTIPFLPSISIDFANFCSTNIDTSPASALPLSSLASCPITLLDEYPSLSSFIHIHSTIILFSLLHPLVPLHQSIKSKAGPFTSVTERLVASIGLHTLHPLLQAMTLLRHLILFSPPHTIEQLQDCAFHCGAMGWLHFGACSPPVAITQPRSQEKEDTSWMSTSIAAEANAVGSSAAPHIRDCCRDLFFLLSSPASIEHYLVPQPSAEHTTHASSLHSTRKTSRANLYNSNRRPSPTLSSQAPSTPSSIDTHMRCPPRSLCSTPSTSPISTSRLSTSQHTSVPRPSRGMNRTICCRRSSSNPLTRHTNGWDTFDQWNISDKKLRQRERQSSVHALWMLRDLIESYTTLQTMDDPQHATQHPLPNPFRAHSDDTVKRTAVDADCVVAGKEGRAGREGGRENVEAASLRAHHDNIPAHPHPRQNTDRAEREGRSFQTDYFTEAHSKDFEDTQILTVAVKRGHSLLSPVGRMVKEATLTKYGCGEKSSWLEALLESERELGCLPIPFLPINSSAFWAMFDSDTRSPVLVWGEKDRQELVSFLLNEMEEYAKLSATANKATDAAMKEDATFTLDPDLVCTYSVEESVKSVMVDGKLAFVFPSSMQYQSHANLNKYKRSFVFQSSGSKAFSQVQSRNDKSHPALATTQGTITNTLLHPPLVIFPPAPTLSHLRLVFTSSLSHVKAGEYFLDMLMEEYAPVLFLVHQHSVENVAQLLASDERRKAGGSQTIADSAERPPALSAEQLEATPATQHIDTMRGIDDCYLADEADRMPLTELENILALVRCSPRLVCAAPSAPILRPFEPTLSADESVASVSLIHTIQRTAAGRESSEQFAEHAEFELLVIDYCVKICATSFALIYTLIHSSKARLLSFKDKNGLALVFSFFNVTPFLSTLYPISSTVQPDDSLLARSAPRRIESALSHPISFPKAHRVIVSLGSLIPLFAANQI
ncbi:hypothetical protein BLNAU_22404 [Blattamonas nauphoetae]|uniref:Thioredoxin domain-containing protein n=1 Tax=Blattamonas nauphoetae TaxID=2049346 RepID=A0ABQ9WT60_9EUKA|nr:hypothetical protein BLNAU_22404 [Blattamonas nauphoetae]